MINKAVRVLKDGGVIIFPTDTVWGIGCSLDSTQAIKRLYKIKKRKRNKPTAVLVGSLNQAEKLGELDKQAVDLAKKYWPGGLTIIVKAKKTVPKIIQGKDNAVGLRMPNNTLLLKILKKLDTAIVASSANFAGKPIARTRKELDNRLIELVDLVLEGESGGDLASTVVDLTQKPTKLVRSGFIPSEKLPLDK